MAQALIGPLTVADLIVIGVFILFAVWKGYRGFYDSLMPFVVAVCALVGAIFVTRLFTDAAIEWVWPWVQRRFAEKVDLSSLKLLDLSQLAEAFEKLLPEVLLNLCDKLGLDVQGYVGTAMETVDAGARQVAETAADALLRSVTAGVVRVVLFLGSWGLLSLALTLIKNAFGLVFELPVIRGVDRTGGVLLGVALCFVLIYTLLWLAALLNIQFILDFARDSVILQWLGHLG